MAPGLTYARTVPRDPSRARAVLLLWSVPLGPAGRHGTGELRPGQAGVFTASRSRENWTEVPPGQEARRAR